MAHLLASATLDASLTPHDVRRGDSSGVRFQGRAPVLGRRGSADDLYHLQEMALVGTPLPDSSMRSAPASCLRTPPSHLPPPPGDLASPVVGLPPVTAQLRLIGARASCQPTAAPGHGHRSRPLSRAGGAPRVPMGLADLRGAGMRVQRRGSESSSPSSTAVHAPAVPPFGRVGTEAVDASASPFPAGSGSGGGCGHTEDAGSSDSSGSTRSAALSSAQVRAQFDSLTEAYRTVETGPRKIGQALVSAGVKTACCGAPTAIVLALPLTVMGISLTPMALAAIGLGTIVWATPDVIRAVHAGWNYREAKKLVAMDRLAIAEATDQVV